MTLLTICSAGFQSLNQSEAPHSEVAAKQLKSQSATVHAEPVDFPQLLIDLVKILEEEPGVLEKMQFKLELMVLSCRGNIIHIVESTQYKEAKTVRAFFRAMTPYFNQVSHYLLQSIVAASECTEAIQRLDKYLDSKDPSAVVIPPPPSSDSSTSGSPAIKSVGAPPTPHSGLTAGVSHVPARTGQKPSGTISISADIECSKLTVEQYALVHHYISSLLHLPAVAVRYDHHQEQCSIRLFWLISGELTSYTQAALGDTTTPQLGILRCLVGCNIKEVSIGDRSYKLPTHLVSCLHVGMWHGICGLRLFYDMTWYHNLPKIQPPLIHPLSSCSKFKQLYSLSDPWAEQG